MIPYVRRQNILNELEKREIIYVDEIAQSLNISASTIRRDLNTLAEEGQIVLLRGGAVKLKTGSYEIPLQTKQLLNIGKKDRIAKHAASLVMDGEVIYIDSGTTTLHMIKYLKNKQITVVTSNTQVINELVESDITCIILGGEITKNLGSVVGPITEKLLMNMFFDKAFIGASGYSLMGGINTPDSREATKKEIVKNNSKITYVLADSSKANNTTFCKAFGIDECTIITDESNELLEKYAKYIVV
jgi:DeoR family fructose operon transcriptional repressor